MKQSKRVTIVRKSKKSKLGNNSKNKTNSKQRDKGREEQRNNSNIVKTNTHIATILKNTNTVDNTENSKKSDRAEKDRGKNREKSKTSKNPTIVKGGTMGEEGQRNINKRVKRVRKHKNMNKR